MDSGLVLFLLIAGHFIADYPLQIESIALGKNRNIDPARFGVNWQYWLGSHAFTHGAFVAVITGNPYLGIAETVMHSLIDFGKCEGNFNIHVDQVLHIVCKLLWFLIFAQGAQHV